MTTVPGPEPTVKEYMAQLKAGLPPVSGRQGSGAWRRKEACRWRAAARRSAAPPGRSCATHPAPARPQDVFRRINAALQTYQASRDREALVASVIATLGRPEHHTLLAGFSLFLPRADRAGFTTRIG